MKDRKILLLLALLGAASAFGSNNDPGSGGGGTTVGNGGSGIECAGKIEVLEIYEARLKGYQDFLPALDDADTLRAARAALAPWKRERTPHDGLITYAYADFQTGLDEFWRNVHLSDAPLPSIEDQGPMPALAPGCRRVQIAAQNTDLNRRLGKTYLIDKSLWERLDNLNRAALVVHEVLYTTDDDFSEAKVGLAAARRGAAREFPPPAFFVGLSRIALFGVSRRDRCDERRR
jgi:hypothetical protein